LKSRWFDSISLASFCSVFVVCLLGFFFFARSLFYEQGFPPVLAVTTRKLADEPQQGLRVF